MRELENVIERAVALYQDGTIDLCDLPSTIQEGGTQMISKASGYSHLSLQEARELFKQAYINEVLTKTNGNIKHASKMAGIAWQNFH